MQVGNERPHSIVRFFCLLPILITLNSVVSNSAVGQTPDYVKFVNNNKMGMKLDAVVIEDKQFSLQIPSGLLQSQNTVSYYFLHNLSFNKGQNIILLYFPNKTGAPDYKSSDLSYEQFQELCEKENIMEELAEVKIHKKRHFRVLKTNGGSFYAIYLNVKSKNVDSFTYSINSVTF